MDRAERYSADFVNSNLTILGAFESGIKTDVAEQFVQKFLEKYENVEGELYLGYPIYIDEVANRRICVDMALVSKIGVYIINILTEPVVKYGEIQDDIYAKVETKFKKQNFLFKKRKLIFDFYTLTYSVTSIDPDVQSQLQSSVNNALTGYTEKDKNGIYKAQASGTCIDNDTGKVVAIVGGREQKNIGYTLNRAYQSPRQPGSAIKPLLVFAPALEHGWSAGSTVNDSPMSTKDKHRVRNANGSYAGQITLRRAVEKSSNVVTMRLYEQLSPKTCLKYLEQMNFKYLTNSDYKYYTTCIGGFTK